METNSDVLIIGGGLAGLTAAIHLSQKNLKVTLIEKSSYPRHKVCGEYISNEILPYLRSLGINVSELNPTKISKFEFSTNSGKTAKAQLPLGGFGISRYALDDFLYQKAISSVNCTIIKENVTDVSFNNDIFNVTTVNQIVTAKIVLGAFGKRSNVDQLLDRNFFHKKSPWLAVKAHYSGNLDTNLVALHNFNGGYCGVSKVENNIINICYLADYATFKQYKNIEDYQQNVLYKNKHLKSVFENSTLLFDKPLTISQISFEKKQPVENHMIMIGDTAGLIHPLCGNGMAMAIHSAKIASELILAFYVDKSISRDQLERNYKKEWNKHFGKRIFMGRILARILTNKTITNMLISVVVSFPKMLPEIIKKTHGKPIAIT
ncbi:NAD(P)/FAD-dependent oxidoreductase [Flavobacterium sp. LC2016-12]|uniref:NAD(P)/FAD-dependent oxidoreductase n=1 Tax=Flavobacterium sp. LC2016-12 TaxID=2783794 RepID=UPI00188D3A0E|nr:NAD(P)/FAD-dependent oxidoreductase [Flavobacterium sp. LC2016-12]MBF4466341.1 NAD(P)/FAD-dependent oxidoreductase [Flavobacterium sp. LC2016-12]